ncbi:MAG TPA: hypothetical protein VGM97_11360 [Steroidobacteraceae bacterium]|jgi:phage terminase Nu1 subunit (DNA packaging protein)
MTNRNQSGFSLREFGRLLGVSHNTICKAIDSGRIPAAAVGEKTLKNGRGVPIITDPAAARVAFEQNADPVRRLAAGKIRSKAVAAARNDPALADLSDANLAQLADNLAQRVASLDLDGDRVPPIVESRAARAAYVALLTRSAYEHRRAALVDAAAFDRKFTALAARALTRLLAVPAAANTRIAHLTASDIETLTALIREAFEGLERADGEPTPDDHRGNPK